MSQGNYPRSLQYFLQRLSGWTSNQLRLNVMGSTSAAASSMIEVALPANTLVSLRSLAMQFDAAFNSVAAVGGEIYVPRYFPNVMIRRAEWSVNGITLSQSSNSYGLVYSALAAASCPPDFQQFNMLNVGAKPSYANPVLTADHILTPLPTYTTTGFLGFGGMETWVNTSLFGSLRLRLSLETNDILGQSVGTDATFNLSNIHFTCTCGSLNDGLYNAALQEKLARQEVIQMPFKAYSVFSQGNTNGGVCSLKATLSSSSVDRLYGLTRANNYTLKTCAAKTALIGGTTPFYTFCGGGTYLAAAANQPLQGLSAAYNTADLTHYQFQVNSVMCPNYLVSCQSGHTAAGAGGAPAHRHGGLAALELRRAVGTLNAVDAGDGLLFCQYAQYPYNTDPVFGHCNVSGAGAQAAGGAAGAAYGGGNAGAAAMAGQNQMQTIYKNYNCITAFSLEFTGDDSRTLSGLNMRGSVGSIYFNATYSAGDQSNQVLICETTQILAISQNGAVELIV